MSNQDFAIAGTSAATLIMLAIQLLKQYGMPSKFAALAAIILGEIFSALAEWAIPTPDMPSEPYRWIFVGIRGFGVGLTSVGMYAVTKHAQDRVDEKRAQDVAEKGDAVLVEVVSPTPDTDEGGAVGEVVALDDDDGFPPFTDADIEPRPLPPMLKLPPYTFTPNKPAPELEKEP